YRDSFQHEVRDSLVHRVMNMNDNSKNYALALTYTEPINHISRMNFRAQINYKGYTNQLSTSNISTGSFTDMIDSLSSNFKSSFMQSRLGFDYTISKSKYTISIGGIAVPTKLMGRNIAKTVTTSRTDLFLIPVFRFQYQLSRSQQIAINYFGSPSEPYFSQIQPIPDFSDPQNPIYGNPDLKPSFSHQVEAAYNNYIANSKLNISGAINTEVHQNVIALNVIQIAQPVTHSFLNEMHFANLNGAKSIKGRYNISKQLQDRKYNLSLSGMIGYNYDVGMSNNVLNHLQTWRFNQQFGPRFNPNISIEINPFISYDVFRTFNSIPLNNAVSSSSDIRTTALSIEGKLYLLKDKTLTIEYNISKNYLSGIASNITKNPLVANFYLEKELFSKKNGVLRLSVFDLFNQNNYVNHMVNSNGYTDIKSNALSRYLSASFILNLQKWSGRPTRDGKILKRRGDGSFIY
ncbi:MAG: hypothetical protein JWQ25_2840, partial [Daejeonella sp.]|nr:hypothetical protein [Daejeonella sp.]